jgi:cysteinyl-tRNA synthetase
MSKSLGNFFTIRDVLKRYDGETLRFFMLRTHYRSPFNFSDVHLDDARAALRRLYTALEGVQPAPGGVDWAHPLAQRFRSEMNEDFNTPGALAALFELVNELNRQRSPELAALVRGLGSTLGLLQQDPTRFLQAAQVGQGGGPDEAAIGQAIAERLAAKQAKDFALADQIRQRLADQGVLLKDSPQGTTWVRA